MKRAWWSRAGRTAREAARRHESLPFIYYSKSPVIAATFSANISPCGGILGTRRQHVWNVRGADLKTHSSLFLHHSLLFRVTTGCTVSQHALGGGHGQVSYKQSCQHLWDSVSRITRLLLYLLQFESHAVSLKLNSQFMFNFNYYLLNNWLIDSGKKEVKEDKTYSATKELYIFPNLSLIFVENLDVFTPSGL